MKTILIVDDSAFTRNIHRQIIEGQGYVAIEADGGEKALKMFSAQRPDLVLVDLLMPDMDGMELIRRLKAQAPDIKTVICSTDKQRQRQQDAKEQGVLAFLIKPINADKLVAVLSELLDDPSAAQTKAGRTCDD